jgi:hypothetical protein
MHIGDSEVANVVPEGSEMAHVAPEEWSGWGKRYSQKKKILLQVGSIRFLKGARAEYASVYSAKPSWRVSINEKGAVVGATQYVINSRAHGN